MPQGIVTMKMNMITPATAKARAIAQPAMTSQMMFPIVFMMRGGYPARPPGKPHGMGGSAPCPRVVRPYPIGARVA